MKKAKLINFFLMLLMAFNLCACGEKTNTIEKLSSNEITATGEFEEGTTLAANKIIIDSEEYNEFDNRRIVLVKLLRKSLYSCPFS